MRSVAEISVLFQIAHTSITMIYTLSLHDALPIWTHEQGKTVHRSVRYGGSGKRILLLLSRRALVIGESERFHSGGAIRQKRSEEHTSELQSPVQLVCRLLLEKKKFRLYYAHSGFC